MSEFVGLGLCLVGAFFAMVGGVALWRLPDTLSRLHALTKADNVGLGLIALGAGLISGDLWFAIKCLLLWLVMLLVSSLSGMVIGSRVLADSKEEEEPEAVVDQAALKNEADPAGREPARAEYRPDYVAPTIEFPERSHGG